MIQAQILTGTWEEIMNQAQSLRGHKNLTLIVPVAEAGEKLTAPDHFYLTAAPNEFQRAFDALSEGNENQALPQEAFDRETLYDEDRF